MHSPSRGVGGAYAEPPGSTRPTLKGITVKTSLITLGVGMIAGAALGCTVSAGADTTDSPIVTRISRQEAPDRHVKHPHVVTFMGEWSGNTAWVETKNGAAYSVTFD